MLHAALLSAAGFDVLRFDYRGYGRSTGRPNEAGTYRDARAARSALPARKHYAIVPPPLVPDAYPSLRRPGMGDGDPRLRPHLTLPSGSGYNRPECSASRGGRRAMRP